MSCFISLQKYHWEDLRVKSENCTLEFYCSTPTKKKNTVGGKPHSKSNLTMVEFKQCKCLQETILWLK